MCLIECLAIALALTAHTKGGMTPGLHAKRAMPLVCVIVFLQAEAEREIRETELHLTSYFDAPSNLH